MRVEIAFIIIVVMLVIAFAIEDGARQFWETVQDHAKHCEYIARLDGMDFYADKMGGFFVKEIVYE